MKFSYCCARAGALHEEGVRAERVVDRERRGPGVGVRVEADPQRLDEGLPGERAQGMGVTTASTPPSEECLARSVVSPTVSPSEPTACTLRPALRHLGARGGHDERAVLERVERVRVLAPWRPRPESKAAGAT